MKQLTFKPGMTLNIRRLTPTQDIFYLQSIRFDDEPHKYVRGSLSGKTEKDLCDQR